ncbi:hypothetical protein [Amycolatopsis sp. NBC_01480]|uniref:hypothetical protein n=1 Tax=Amycolatopsis sp. NBC_01480 TaxID=2903562 RepID=UPI002E28A3C2|nr:hypothetical protein [Amycolatopsis sp. NBC_01480]
MHAGRPLRVAADVELQAGDEVLVLADPDAARDPATIFTGRSQAAPEPARLRCPGLARGETRDGGAIGVAHVVPARGLILVFVIAVLVLRAARKHSRR